MSFQRGFFSQMRMSGLGTGLSISKLAKMMIDVLVQLPPGTQNLKDAIVQNMGFIGQMSGTREINAAWAVVKKKAAKEYPDRFLLGERGVLGWNDGTKPMLDKKISPANIKKLNSLAEMESCSVNEVVAKLIKTYQSISIKNTKKVIE
jgi:hypothetical protein